MRKCGISLLLRLGIGSCLSSKGGGWHAYLADQPEVLFLGLVSEISGGEMPNKVTGSSDALTVAGSAGSYTFQAPNTAEYIAADTDKIWFQLDDTPRVVTTAELIGYDLQRTPVYYDNEEPNTVRSILILKAGEVLAENKLNYLFRVFALHPLWNDSWNDNGVLKSNRGLEQILWTPI